MCPGSQNVLIFKIKLNCRSFTAAIAGSHQNEVYDYVIVAHSRKLLALIDLDPNFYFDKTINKGISWDFLIVWYKPVLYFNLLPFNIELAQ